MLMYVILQPDFLKTICMHSIRLSLLFITITLLLCGQITIQAQNQVQLPGQKQQKSDFPSEDAFKNSKITYKLISGINNTWGYDILVEHQMEIHQPSIPGQPGNEGFKTREGAEKVAKLVIKKMKKGEMPPSIDEKEMKRLKSI
jgi:hypothetical protein